MLKVEKKMPVKCAQAARYGDWHDFISTLTKLRVGESFLFPRLASNHRLIIGSAPTLLGKHFRAAREGKSFRVGRVQ